jgi:hypothetical protein
MADYDIKEIADARYMGLMCPPASPEAKALVNDIINIIEQAEQRQRARKVKDMAAFIFCNHAIRFRQHDLTPQLLRKYCYFGTYLTQVNYWGTMIGK